ACPPVPTVRTSAGRLRLTLRGTHMLTRRDWLTMTMSAGAALALDPRRLLAQQQPVITRAIPSTGERIPIVGLGSSATFAQVAREADQSALAEVFKTLVGE